MRITPEEITQELSKWYREAAVDRGLNTSGPHADSIFGDHVELTWGEAAEAAFTGAEIEDPENQQYRDWKERVKQVLLGLDFVEGTDWEWLGLTEEATWEDHSLDALPDGVYLLDYDHESMKTDEVLCALSAYLLGDDPRPWEPAQPYGARGCIVTFWDGLER